MLLSIHRERQTNMGMGVVAAHESPWPVTLVRALVRNTEVLAGQDAVGSRDVVDLESSSMDGKADVRHIRAITHLRYVVSAMKQWRRTSVHVQST
jgi:hypothetical protein